MRDALRWRAYAACVAYAVLACALAFSAPVTKAQNAAIALPPAGAPRIDVMRIPLAQLEASLPAGPTLRLFEITDQPGLYVMHAPSLAAQGAMFSRVVALIERRDMPRDRVVSMNAIVVSAMRFGQDPAGLTAGNNFSTAQIAHFFDLAQRQPVTLTEGERTLLSILVRWGLLREEGGGWRAASTRDYLITIPATGKGPAGEVIDTVVRSAILSHELGHWRFFSNPTYAQACRTFWWRQLSLPERTALTQQLSGIGYDPSDRIMIDELQAYLLHTPARFVPLADTPGPDGVDIARVKRGLEQSVRNAGQ
jgi:hypothetical protein